MTPIEKKESDLLVEHDIVSKDDIAAAKEEGEKQNKPFFDALLARTKLTEEKIGTALSKALGSSFCNLKAEHVDEGVFHLIPQVVAASRGIIAFGREKEGISVGMIDPRDLEMRHFLEKRLSEPIIPCVITLGGLSKALKEYKGSLAEAFKNIYQRIKDTTLSREQRDSATVELVDVIVRHGYINRVSDIHIEPFSRKILVRFRIDGVMHDVLEMPKELSDLIVTRIKILSRMRTDEHRAAQDGKFRFTADGEQIDVRVSVVPVTYGENIVMRLLSTKAQQFNLSDLGFAEQDLKKVQRAIKKPYGMVLVTGPTGSGKTTTVYAFLKILNKRDVHIITIEDPVEYDIEGVTQIQVDPKTNLTFAKGLRAIVRQDPDTIMVGEIRDAETAGIAVNSAMTGHLVLSTLHANDSATTLPRMLDMGIEPFLLATTVNIVVAQRLVRKICEKCRESYTITTEEKRLLEEEPMLKEKIIARGTKAIAQVRWYHGKGCGACSHTGYRGRLGIYEVMELSEKTREAILRRAPSEELMELAVKEGMTTMLDDGLEKIFLGTTTLHEVIRVTRT
ncbi:type II/IV secretion system protein [Candidatus Uhrbacteria bacterium]|nr:type II/IV secretion system protein [Candidatus Uhrbacteria bacterium]